MLGNCCGGGKHDHGPKSCAVAAAIRSSRRSWPLRPISISPTGPLGSLGSQRQRDGAEVKEAYDSRSHRSRDRVWIRNGRNSGHNIQFVHNMAAYQSRARGHQAGTSR
jgi:hypothetical protein